MPGSLYGALHRAFGTPMTTAKLNATLRTQQKKLVKDKLLPEGISQRDLAASETLRGMRVAVVGAGFAGLTAAWFLQKCGAVVTVYEASDRIGGRVHTDHTFIPGKVVEAGAELIGNNHAMWQVLHRALGLSLTPVTEDKEYLKKDWYVPLRFGDEEISPAAQKKLYKELTGYLDILGQEAKGVDPIKPWLSPNAVDLDRRTVAEALDNLGASAEVRRVLDLMIHNDNCAPSDRQSYLGLLALISAGRVGPNGMRGYWEHTETHRCKQGNQSLGERLAQGLDVRLATPVREISMFPDGAMITTADGVTTRHAYAVLAVPAPAWNTIKVDPPFDAAEYSISHGKAVKFLTAYSAPYWEDQKRAPSARWDRLGSVWENTDGQDPTVQGSGLTVYSGGDYVQPEGASKYGELLAALYPSPGGARPISSRLVNWPNTPWIMTGNSVPAPGEVTTVARRLNEPYMDRLYFAGEQTCIGFYGYMEGALRSGARAALNIVNTQLAPIAQKPTSPASTQPFEAVPPLGPAEDATLAEQREHARTLGAHLAPDLIPFAGDRVFQRWVLSQPQSGPLTDLRRIVAIWHGWPSVVDQKLRILLKPSAALQEMFGAQAPVTATYGPIETIDFPGEVHAGQHLGWLAGSHLDITLQDQNGFYLDPKAIFARFEQQGLWTGTGGARNPLLIDGDYDGLLDVSGPRRLTEGTPHLILRGGSGVATVHNPPDQLAPEYFSFLSTDPITIDVAHSPPPLASLTIEDISEPMYRTRLIENPIIRKTGHTFIAQRELQPNLPEDGSREPAVPLVFKIDILNANTPLLTVTIRQDERDRIRQEYVMRNARENGKPLRVPDRNEIEIARRPEFSTHFSLKQFTDHNNYSSAAGGFLMNGTEMFHVAEFIRHLYINKIDNFKKEEIGQIPDTIVSFELAVTSSWRNPERNEEVGGDWRSNHQYGRALDIAPMQPMNSVGRAPLVKLLFESARDFLDQLITLNGQSALGDVEILLEKAASKKMKQIGGILWQYKFSKDGISLVKGPNLNKILGKTPADDAVALELAIEFASHVHVAWNPKNFDSPLKLPEIPGEELIGSIEPAPEVYRNIILIATESSDVPKGDQLPLDIIAKSLKNYLEKDEPEYLTEIHEVSNAIDWFRHCDMFNEEPTFRVRHFFSFSHAWPQGLTLKNFPKDTHIDKKRDAAVDEKLSQLYSPINSDMSHDLPIGPDDFREFLTNQLRISNLNLLPENAKMRLQRTFAHAEGIFVVGCRNAHDDKVEGPPFCQVLANTIQNSVYGANYYSKVFMLGIDEKWEPKDIHRGENVPADRPVVLVPGEYGVGQSIWYVLSNREWVPDIQRLPDAEMDLLKIYQRMLTECPPVEEF